MIVFYHQIKMSINSWYRWRLNFRFLIQSSKTLLVELTGIYTPSVILSNITPLDIF